MKKILGQILYYILYDIYAVFLVIKLEDTLLGKAIENRAIVLYDKYFD